ncbi:tetratricopeptide repeat-containing sensor histidine kinase [Flavobacterium sp.]|uniref:tetratricopeptide repeat-containing sensor histidine kinase n=1 Tax=Flavobacterium sp. TaxID=239 RepID=UPI002B4B329F|nr:tetratricopeptide repeat protein [Flavobacterium sp.]HLP63415.1 tetratricopeptide repeat protein [Flavobacterium sp.]
MKYWITFFFIFFIFGCKDNKDFDSTEFSSDSIDIYINFAKNENLNYQKRNEFSQKAYTYLSKKNDSISRKKIFDIAVVLSRLNNSKEFLRVSNFLITNTKISNDKKLTAKTYNLIANHYIDLNKIDSAFIYLVKAEKVYKTLEDNISFGKNYLEKAYVQFIEGDYFGCEQSSSFALSYLKGSNDFKNIYNAYNYIGISSNELKNFDNALNYHFKALEIAKKSNFDTKLHLSARSQNNIGFVYQNLNEHKKAIEYFREAMKDEKLLIDSPDLYSMLIDNYAYSKFKIKDFEELPKLFYKAIRISEENGFTQGLFLNKIHLSEYYNYVGDTLNAKKFAEEALVISKSTNVSGDILASLKQLSIVDKVNSSRHSRDYIRISDSLQVAERNSLDRFARLQLETDEIIQQNTQLSEQNRDILNYFAIAIVFGGFLFFARFQRLKARELALKQTQQQANEEIYRLIISHQNQLEEGRDLEKKRISKELHDGVLGRLFGLRLNLDGLNNFDDEETKQQRLEYLNELKVIEQDLREISHELSRENLVLINNFVAIINNLLEQQSKINKAKINTLISDKIDWEKVSNTIKINLYRILQEALQNINKHAEANKINVIFNKDPKGNLIFSVEDDGKGYNTNGKKTKGIGMNNIVDRVHQCQGKIDIKSQIGKGTKIIITFPLENETINM